MIYYDGDLGSIIESIYLRENLDEHLSVSDIVVNPANPQYIFCKVVIINDPTYEWSKFLIERGCKVITRVKEIQGDYCPYIIRPDMMIQWNGEVIESNLPYPDLCKDILENHLKYDDGKLYFPKIISSDIPYGSALSWALHQVGINYFEGKFQDLDLIKLCKKGALRTP